MLRKILPLALLLMSAIFPHFTKAACNPNAYFSYNTNYTNVINLTPGNVSANSSIRWFVDGEDYFHLNLPASVSTNVELPEGQHQICMEVYDSANAYCTTYCNDYIYTGDSICSLTAAINYTNTGNTYTFSAVNPAGSFHQWYIRPFSMANGNWPYIAGASPLTSSSSTFSYTFATADTFIITHKVGAAGGCGDSATIILIVGGNSNCNTIASFTDSVSSYRIYAHATTVNPPPGTIYKWYLNGQLESIGYGASSFISNTLSNGSYNLLLELWNGGVYCSGVSNQLQVTTTCNPNTNASFTYTTGVNSISAVSNSSGISGSTYYKWFRNGTLLSQGFNNSSCNFTSLSPGTYNICLMLYTGPSSNSLIPCDTFCQSIMVGTCSANSNASFIYDYDGSSLNLFSNSVGVNGNTYFVWKRNGTTIAQGSGISSATVAPAPSGSNICLYMYNGSPAGGNPLCDSTCVLLVADPLVCDTASLTVSTYADTIYGQESISWDNANTYIRYYIDNILVSQGYDNFYFQQGGLTAGTHTVCMKVYSGLTSSSLTLCDSVCTSIVVGAGGTCPPNINASFTYGITAADSIHVTSNSTGTNSSTYYKWFLNGTLWYQGLNLPSASFGNLAPGYYTTCLQLWAGSGNNVMCDSVCNTVTVGAYNCSLATVASFSAIATPGTIDVHSTSTMVGSNTYYKWYRNGVLFSQGFEDTTATAAGLAAGTYQVCLQLFVGPTASVLTACDTFCQNVTVNSVPCTAVAGFNVVASHDTVYTSSTSTGITGATYYRWYRNGVLYRSGYSVTNTTQPGLANGTYTICLKLYNDTTAAPCDTICQIITVNNICTSVANFFYNIGANTINASSNSSGVNANSFYGWYSNGTLVNSGFGASASSAVIPYQSGGTYTVCLQLSTGPNAGNLTPCDTFCQTITIPNAPCTASANYIADVDGGTIYLHSISNGVNANTFYLWKRNGVLHSQGTGVINDTIMGLTPGNSSVCLYLYNGTPSAANFCDSLCTSITVAPLVCGNDSINVWVSGDSIYGYATMSWANSSNYYRWYIDNVLVLQGYDQTYFNSVQNPGAHTVCMKVYTGLSATTLTLCDSVCQNVIINTPPCTSSAGFTYTLLGSVLQTSSSSTGVNSSTYYRWLNNGSLIAQGFGVTNTTLTGVTQGTYNVCLQLFTGPDSLNLTPCDTSCQVISVGGPCNSIASFTANTFNNDSIYASSTSTGVNSSTYYKWFINGTLHTAGFGFVNSGFGNLSPGSYNVCLQLFSGPNVNSLTPCDTFCQAVVINNVPCTAVANFTSTTTSNSMTLTSTSTGTNSSTYYKWFRNGILITQGYNVTNPSFFALAPGTYNVCLQLFTGPNSSSLSPCDTICQSVTITAPPCTSIAFLNVSSIGNSINATGTAVNPTSFTYYEWYVNGVLYAQGFSDSVVTLSPFTPGTYNVCLNLSNGPDSFNLTLCDTLCQTITVGNNPCNAVANFSAYTFNNDSIYTSSTSTGVNSSTYYKWFINGTLHSAGFGFVNAGFGNLNAGSYNICLQLFSGPNSSNLSPCDTICQVVTISPPPCTQIAWINVSSTGNAINATGTAVTPTSFTYYEWFVNGVLYAQGFSVSVVSFSPFAPGTYNVCLHLSSGPDSFNLTLCDTLCQTITVGNTPCNALANFSAYTFNADSIYTSSTSTGVNSSTYFKWFINGTLHSAGFGFVNAGFGNLNAGSYNICLQLFTGPNSSNLSPCDTFCQTVTITAPPCSSVANFSYTVNSNSNSITVISTSSGTNANTFYGWYGNGTLVSNGFGANASSAVIPYQASGSFTICLALASGPNINSLVPCDTICQTINVTIPVCNAYFTATQLSCNTFKFDTSAFIGSSLVWSFGDGTQTSSVAEPTHTYTPGTSNTVKLIAYGNAGCTDTFSLNLSAGLCDTLCGIVFNDIDADGIQDAGEVGIGNRPIVVNGVTLGTTNAQGLYRIPVAPGSYSVMHCPPAGYAATLPNFNNLFNQNCPQYLGVWINNNQTICGLNFGVRSNQVNICGTVYLDVNNNGVFDANESIVSGATVHITNSNGTTYNTVSSMNGTYCYTAPAGNYTLTVTLPGSYSGYGVTPASINLVTVASQIYNNNNFGVSVPAGVSNLCISIAPSANVSPGHYASYYLYVTNTGSIPMFGTVDMYYDPLLVFQYANPAQATHDAVNKILTWNLTSLAPGATRSYYVRFNTPATALLGAPVFHEVDVMADASLNEADMSCNFDTIHQTVLSSWDPNNKIVNPVGQGANGAISSTQPLHYTINFQNTGTAPATNVIVKDLIDADLDMSTLQLEAVSHYCSMSFDDSRMVTWQFPNILLPDSFSNEPASHGFIQFVINLNSNLPQGTQITNSADIYFDFNAPIVTNSTLNTIDYKISIGDFETEDITITLMPNPFGDHTNILLEGAAPGVIDLIVYDMTGKQVLIQKSSSNLISVERGSLASGVYFYELRQGNKTLGKGKMVAE